MKLTLTEKLVMQTIFTESSHYLLVEETNVGEKISQTLFSWQCSIPQLFYTPLSKKFLEFGEVHDGKFKKPYNNISNGKGYIRITHYKTKHDLPHEIFFDDS